jgi:hypothetical protein
MTSPAKGSKGGASRSISRSPRKSGGDDLAAGLSARMGDLLLTEKETSGLVIRGVDSGSVPRPRWAIVGKVCSPLCSRTGYAKSMGSSRANAVQRHW